MCVKLVHYLLPSPADEQIPSAALYTAWQPTGCSPFLFGQGELVSERELLHVVLCPLSDNLTGLRRRLALVGTLCGVFSSINPTSYKQFYLLSPSLIVRSSSLLFTRSRLLVSKQTKQKFLLQALHYLHRNPISSTI